ncbi:MAG: hypothetical protein KA768_09370 [Desulfobulbus sp.]|uniref:hypothetical protein n=1 Tax=uncultured Desulfobulbus sp. TaxID=239745 RepID=UPI001B6DC998|nr:hypothetical protein [uncultured Desulfobulbus sp.]MBP7518030.1 hypothetical protein [Desulfobulbus sp.]
MHARTTAALVLLATLALTGGPTRAAVSISVAEPNFYGRIDIGGFPSPRVVYEQPVIVRRVRVWNPPIYLRVPPGHMRHWDRHCHEYEACGRPVYFVDDGWYREVYVPRYREIRPQRRVYHPPPPPPVYYEYRYDRHRPPKKVYVDQGPPRNDVRGPGRAKVKHHPKGKGHGKGKGNRR